MAQKWSPLLGISKEEFERRRKQEKLRGHNPQTRGGAPTNKKADHSDEILQLLDVLGKTSGPAADALATRDGLTVAQVTREIGRARRQRMKK